MTMLIKNKTTASKPCAFPHKTQIKDIAYDEYGSRKFIEYGNGVKTWYNYDENRRWLDTIRTQGNNWACRVNGVLEKAQRT